MAWLPDSAGAARLGTVAPLGTLLATSPVSWRLRGAVAEPTEVPRLRKRREPRSGWRRRMTPTTRIRRSKAHQSKITRLLLALVPLIFCGTVGVARPRDRCYTQCGIVGRSAYYSVSKWNTIYYPLFLDKCITIRMITLQPLFSYIFATGAFHGNRGFAGSVSPHPRLLIWHR